MNRSIVTGVFLGLALSACAHRGGEGGGQGDLPSVLAPSSSSAQLSLPAAGSLWNQDPESLFGNRRARVVGDILTVIVEIDEEAELENEVDRTRTTAETFSMRNLLGGARYAENVLPAGATLDPGVDFDRSRTFSGAGTVRRQDRITLRLAARVVDTLPNGDLVIDGHQEVRVNHDTRVLRASGVVRPEDISRTNTIPHDRIADAQIGYVGRGALNRNVKPRAGNRLLDIIIPF